MQRAECSSPLIGYSRTWHTPLPQQSFAHNIIESGFGYVLCGFTCVFILPATKNDSDVDAERPPRPLPWQVNYDTGEVTILDTCSVEEFRDFLPWASADQGKPISIEPDETR